ncbi:phosphogluconate dehydrogenase (NAD(+)-dependent, decarboxylating) [Dellaglioa algida]|uniref:6-phosphogluconate dehydrogenase n=1 Tax=Dellaglioa algida TaxID=105612 RepID=A0A2C8ES12_9LACO|nr:decarboxylating 6-phosphogluconate dehydrogenase [Dellaglioa algida]MDK1716096.1 decarboxylating 6-phosphogluconate dehydrogenase [Dellaglioa algida]MDK1717789.1 decarboxylating 6-phosphogluconate dehydrogenase [Dellaglioa algida]MDK1719377.1 decarboxylating 6-phosphogluconate dehydrogenase [Dellaglioa algida]MDK1721121.1 decarboxylating 6-phosphogluconate dehydrogenase [Dellaglioa algida]MDK1722720.1 decarboxylating 6-phosphogluconate dehydrogenase [Dellaglioa algida]
MRVGMIGLGKMGLSLTKNMLDNGIEVVGFDLATENVKAAEEAGAISASSLEDFVSKLGSTKITWLLLPAGAPTDATIVKLTELLNKDDLIVDGGNSNFKDSLRHNKIVTEAGMRFFDCGTSGGQSGARNGGNFMIGGDDADAFNQYLDPIFKLISEKDGYLYTGAAGSGHYLKMVHNGIEYGMMQAIGEGFDVLESGQYDYDNEAVAKLWNHGSVIRSWLMELVEDAFSDDAHLDDLLGRMHSSGEGQWTLQEALDSKVPTPVIALSVMMRYESMRNVDANFTGKVVAAMRHGFGGHVVDKS